MRARNLRPSFDRLDIRLVLDASAATLVSGSTLASTIMPVVNSDGSTTNQQDIVDILDWYLPGSPPPDAGDPTSISVPWEQTAND